MQVFLSHLIVIAPKIEIKSLLILIVDSWDLLSAVFSKAIILFTPKSVNQNKPFAIEVHIQRNGFDH